jgi:hypothetical protein
VQRHRDQARDRRQDLTFRAYSSLSASAFATVGAPQKSCDGVDESAEEAASQGAPVSASITGAAPCVAVPLPMERALRAASVTARSTPYRLGPRSLPTPLGIDDTQRRIRRARAHGERLGHRTDRDTPGTVFFDALRNLGARLLCRRLGDFKAVGRERTVGVALCAPPSPTTTKGAHMRGCTSPSDPFSISSRTEMRMASARPISGRAFNSANAVC